MCRGQKWTSGVLFSNTYSLKTSSSTNLELGFQSLSPSEPLISTPALLQWDKHYVLRYDHAWLLTWCLRFELQSLCLCIIYGILNKNSFWYSSFLCLFISFLTGAFSFSSSLLSTFVKCLFFQFTFFNIIFPCFFFLFSRFYKLFYALYTNIQTLKVGFCIWEKFCLFFSEFVLCHLTQFFPDS